MARIEIDPNYSSPTFSRATAGTDQFKKEDVQSMAAALSTHDHTSGKGLLLPASAIATGLITSAMIADGTITTADIVAQAITRQQATGGVTVNPQTTSATYVDMPDMTVTMSTVGGEVVAWLIGVFNSAQVAQSVSIALNVDGGTDVAGMSAAAPGVGYGMCISTLTWWTGLSAATHTFRGRWSTTGSTATCVTTQRTLLVMEFKR